MAQKLRCAGLEAFPSHGTGFFQLVRVIHEGSAATVDLAFISGVLAILALDVLFKYAGGPKSLRAPEPAAIGTVSL